MAYTITCPYCFKQMQDDEVMFRSEKVNKGESDILPDRYADYESFEQHYTGADKEFLKQQYLDWEFYKEAPDPIYEEWWRNYGGTTENNPADLVLKIRAYRRKVIDPMNPEHQQYLTQQPDGSYVKRDEQGMVTQVELNTPAHELCNRRVCRHCHNPLPDNYGKNPVKFATVVGITGAGKTIYLSQLLRKMRSYATKVGLSAIVTNSGVRTFLDNNKVAANEQLPGSTPAEQFQQPLFYELVQNLGGNRKKTETFVLYDVAGEVFKDANLVTKFAPFVAHADGVLVLIDPMQFEVVTMASEHGKQLDEPVTVLEVIHNIFSHGHSDKKCDVPFAICMSKADMPEFQQVLDPDLRAMLLEEVQGVRDRSGYNLPLFNARDYNTIAEELNRFIQDNEMDLAEVLRDNYSTYDYFAFTALGCEVDTNEENGYTYQYPVGPVLPKRVEEPILWLFNRLGYIGENEPIFTPNRTILRCPNCDSDNTHKLPEGSTIKIKKGFLRKEEILVTHECADCGYAWDAGDEY